MTSAAHRLGEMATNGWINRLRAGGKREAEEDRRYDHELRHRLAPKRYLKDRH